MSSDSSSPAEPAPAAPIPPATASATPPAAERAMAEQPSVISLMHPQGFTPYAVEGLTLDKPLFARVTYRPE